MIFKASFALALLSVATSPSFAQMKSGDAMPSGDARVAPMKPMTAAQKAMMAKCAKMSSAAAKKNAKCAKRAATHPASQM